MEAIEFQVPIAKNGGNNRMFFCRPEEGKERLKILWILAKLDMTAVCDGHESRVVMIEQTLCHLNDNTMNPVGFVTNAEDGRW